MNKTVVYYWQNQILFKSYLLLSVLTKKIKKFGIFNNKNYLYYNFIGFFLKSY